MVEVSEQDREAARKVVSDAYAGAYDSGDYQENIEPMIAQAIATARAEGAAEATRARSPKALIVATYENSDSLSESVDWLLQTAEIADRMMAAADPRREPIVKAIRTAARCQKAIATARAEEREHAANYLRERANDMSSLSLKRTIFGLADEVAHAGC